MKALKSLIERRKDLKKITLSEKDVFYIFGKVIKKEFGEIGAGKFQFEYFGKKVLVVRCESAPWASELWINKDKIMRKMNEELGEGTVEKIRTK